MITKNRKKILFAFCLFLCSNSVFANFKNADIAILNPDPYSQALGASILSLSPSIFGFFANPASNYKNFSKEIQFSYTSVYDNIYGASAGIIIPTERAGNFSVVFSGVEYNKNINTSDFKNSTMFALNYVYPLVKKYPIFTEKGALGATFKFYSLKNKHDDSDFNLYSADLGFIYCLDFIDRNLTGALAAKNIGNDIQINNILQKQYKNFTASARYLISDDYKISLMTDMVKNPELSATGFACGLETKPVYPLSLRVGWRDYMDNFNKGITAGFSVNFDRVNIAYAYSDILATSDDQHVFSLGFYFGSIPDAGKAYDHYLGYYLNMAKNDYANKNYISARNQFEDILAIYPQEPVAKRYLQLLSEDLDQTDRDFSGKVERYLAVADAAFLKNNLVKAQKYYSKALSVDNKNQDAILGLKKVEQENAQQQIQSNRKKHQKEIIQSWMKAMKYFDRGDFVFAKDELLKITEIDPTNAGALQYLDFIEKKVEKVNAVQANDIFKQGLKEYEAGNYEKALTYFNTAYIASPDRQDVKEYIEKSSRQINESKQVVSQAPANSSGKDFLTNKQVAEQMKRVYNKALEQFNESRYDEALKTFNMLKVMSSKNKFFDYNEQIKTYTKKSNQAIADQLYKQGKDFEMQEELSKAYDMYKEVLKYAPDHKEAKTDIEKLKSVIAQQYYDKGLQSFSAGDRQNAVIFLEQALKYEPSKIEAKKALERIK